MDVDHLIDIAVFNEVRDWDKVAEDGIKGASIKVSQQVNYLNPLAGQQFAGAQRVGIAAGGYHFGDPRVSAARQASYFVANARGLGAFRQGALAPMYDAENWEGGGLIWPNPKTLNEHIAEHIRVVREETGVLEHLVYGSLSWWLDGWIDPDIWGDEHVLNWIAVYNGDPGNLSTSGRSWSHPNDALHQHTSSGIVPGVVGRVDKNTTLRDRRIADLTIGNTEDDMQLSDRMENAWGGTPTLAEVFRYIDWRSSVAVDGIEQLQLTLKAQADTLAAIAEDANIDAERLTAIIDSSVNEGLARVSEGLIGMVRTAVNAELGTDNEEQAERIVAAIGRQLARNVQPPSQSQ